MSSIWKLYSYVPMKARRWAAREVLLPIHKGLSNSTLVRIAEHGARAQSSPSLSATVTADPSSKQPLNLAQAATLRAMLLNMAKTIPSSDGCAFYERIPRKALILSDSFMFNFYRDCFKVVDYADAERLDELLSNDYDLFIYVTCWEGLKNDEWRGIGWRPLPTQRFDQIISHCAANKIPMIFQSIEDPSNFERFLPIAQRFDYIFTSDADMVDEYKKAVGHGSVFYGEYGINPQLNNPIGCRRFNINGAFFAGSYPMRYPDRCADMHSILRSIAKSGHPLVIADRNYGAGHEPLMFPAEYLPHLIDKLDHEILQKIHKIFRYSINFNSVKSSTTMCAMRVYELQAQGKSIISSYAKSVYNLFPNITLMPALCDASPYFVEDQAVELAEYETAMDSVRHMMTSRTCFDIVGLMLERTGTYKRAVDPVVVVIARGGPAKAKTAFDRQTYPSKILVDGEDAGQAVQCAKLFGRRVYFTYFAEGHVYGDHYLQDMVNAFKYTNSRFITRSSFEGRLDQNLEHEFTGIVAGPCRTLFDADHFAVADFKAADLEQYVQAVGGYSIDRFGYKPQPSVAAESRAAGNAPRLSVIIPVFNNGEFLTTKCLASLKRNVCFPDMEVIVVDDGSTDPGTTGTLARIEREYPNAKVHRTGATPSGSASRPRNIGMDLAQGDLVTFLDPDNEISPAGYDELLNQYEAYSTPDAAVDFVSGYQIKVGQSNVDTGRHAKEESTAVENPGDEFFSRGEFPVLSTQACLIDRKFLELNYIRFVEGAVGQDTLFGWEVLHHAKRGVFTNRAFLLYYFERSGSVTNSLDEGYFEKSLILEREQKERLQRYGLYQAYLDHRHDTFFVGWYMKKLAQTNTDRKQAAIDILNQIQALHGRPSISMSDVNREVTETDAPL